MGGRQVRCLALVTDAFGGRGGIAQYNRDFVSALAASDPALSVIVLPRRAAHGFAVPAAISQRPPRSGKLAYALTALFLAFRRRIDIVFCGHLYMAPLAWLVARLKGAKLVLQTHGIEAWPRPSRTCRAAAEAADLVLCVSRYTRACITGWAAIEPERVIIIPNTVSDEFSPGDGSSLRRALRLDGKQMMLTVGRMDLRERYKGHDRVIAAIPDLVRRGHDVGYIIVGEGDDQARLQECVQREGVADRVRFLGAVGTRCLAEAYHSADLYVMPSTGEGFGIVFLEAMASGTAALGLNVAGTRDALADGELGALVAEQDDLADAIDHILTLPKPDREALSRSVRTRFGRAAFAAQVGMVLDRLMVTA